jgi:hypothetical protein
MAFPPYTADHLDSSSQPVTFTSQGEIEREFSTRGLKLHTDDMNSEDDNYDLDTDPDVTVANAIEETIQQVTSGIMEHLAPRYLAKDIDKIPRIREIATYWACHKLSKRRGNQGIFEDEYINSIDILEQYKLGLLYLDAPSNGPRAILQSFITDNRYHRNPTRVLPYASTNVKPGQHRIWAYPFAWL